MDWFAFVSGDGRVAGLARRVEEEEEEPLTGVVLAVLETVCSVTEWTDLLASSESPEEAAASLVKARGGTVVFKIVPIHSVTRVFLPTTEAEA
jgi:hypothetical protein